jgi:hypothetical protein
MSSTPVAIDEPLYKQLVSNAAANKRSIKKELEFILEQWFGGVQGEDIL